METQPLIRLEAVRKSFRPVHANRAIVLELHTVPILALLGENGAGKSTLVSILAGNLNEALSLSDRIGLSMAGVTS